jgi:hypothetical protein
MWCIGKITGDYLANMEDVLDLYAEPAQQGVARICFDERPCQLLGEVIAPMRAKPGQTVREHQEYVRNGVCNVLLAYDIDRGQRYMMVSPTKKREDYARFMAWLEKEHYADFQKVKVVQDNYSTHTYGSFYEHLEPAQARALSRKLEFHFTPKHGSWLNMAEMEFSALSRQCLDRRVASMEKLQAEAIAWQEDRNRRAVRINWSFTCEKARETMASCYGQVRT